MAKQLGKEIDKEAMFKKIMPSAGKPISAKETSATKEPAATFDSDVDGFSAPRRKPRAAPDVLDMSDDFGSLDMLDSLGSFDALDSFDLFDDTPAPRKAPSKQASSNRRQAPAPSAKAAPSGAKASNAKAPASAAKAGKVKAAPARHSPLPTLQNAVFPIDTTVSMSAPAAPTAPTHPMPSSPMAAANAPTPEGYAIGVQCDLLDDDDDIPANYAVPGTTAPPLQPQLHQPQMQQPQMQQPMMQQPQMQQPMMQQPQMQQPMMQQPQMQQPQMQQPMMQQPQMQQPMMQQPQMQQPMMQQPIMMMPYAPPQEAAQSLAQQVPPTPPEPEKEKLPQVDPETIIPVNISEIILTAQLDNVIDRLHACKCEKCKTDAAAFALNRLPVRYTLSGKLQEEELFDRVSVSQTVTSLCHAVLFVKSHPRH